MEQQQANTPAAPAAAATVEPQSAWQITCVTCGQVVGRITLPMAVTDFTREIRQLDAAHQQNYGHPIVLPSGEAESEGQTP